MNDSPSQTFRAVLLLGPTGAGKTPLGEWLEATGLAGRRCHHFDFGANLRATVRAGPSGRFASDEIQFLQSVLADGILLENESFHLAKRILDAFISQRAVQPADWIVMNGLPRHVGQAEAMERRLEVVALIQLECDAHVIRERLRRNVGGDRAVRTDDTDELVTRKLATYQERTRPLAAYYQERGARLIAIPVGVETQPRDLAEQIERLGLTTVRT